MNAAPLGRRLMAILAVDVAGYSRLAERDEAGTVERLRLLRRELATPLVEQHHGRIVKLMGDGALCEFPSVVDAVTCAMALQKGVADREDGVPEEQRIRLRIGINLGDVIVDGDDIYGDGVNVTARLEALAEPGEIRVSDAVRQHAEGKVAARFEDLGQHRVKNIDRPVHVYRVTSGSSAIAAGRPGSRARSRPLAGLFLLGTVAAAVVLGLWWTGQRTPRTEVASVAAMALPLPAEPSIVALPLSTEPDEEEGRRLSAGLTVELATELRARAGLFVIAPETALRAGEAGLGPKAAAERFGVRFVLHGRLEPGAGRQAAIQLTDALAGAMLWERRYDLARDLPALRQDVARDLLRSIRPESDGSAPSSPCSPAAASPSPEVLHAYLGALAAMGRYTLEDSQQAERLLAQATRLEASDAGLQAWRARNAVVPLLMEWVAPERAALDQAAAAAAAATALLPECHFGLWAAGVTRMLAGDHAAALALVREALALSPTDPDLLATLAKVLAYMGESREGRERGNAALRYNPIPPEWYYWNVGIAAYLSGESEAAVDAFAHAERHSLEALVYFAASDAELGRRTDTGLRAREILRRNPRFAIEDYLAGLATLPPEAQKRLASALQSAGLPINVSFECVARNVCP